MTDPTTQPRVLAIPELSLVALVGASGSGKSTFARRHFGRYEVISSDVCRGMVSVDENDQSVTADAFELLGHIAGKRLAAGHLTVVDATNVQRDARRHVLDLAKANDVLPVAIVLDLREEICATRGTLRTCSDPLHSGAQANRPACASSCASSQRFASRPPP